MAIKINIPVISSGYLDKTRHSALYNKQYKNEKQNWKTDSTPTELLCDE